MNESDFINEINKNIDGVSIDELKTIILEICKDVPKENYFKTLCRMKNRKSK